MNMKALQAVLSLVLSACPLSAAEFRPVAVWTEAECYATPPGKYAAGRMIDGDLGTYACLLDDTRTGKDPRVWPPKAAPPVTASFVLDLGAERTVTGMRFVARNAWVYVLAKNVSISACGDAQGKAQLRPLVENTELPATSNSNSAFAEWSPVQTRYLKVRVNDSYQKRYPGPWMPEAQIPWCRKVGLPTAGDGKNLNTQIAEITCYDARPVDFPVKNPPDITMPRHRLERDWLYQDAGLDIARVFTSASDCEKESSMVQRVLGRVADDEPGLKALWQRLDQLAEAEVPACDPRWRSLYLDACAARRKTRLQALRGKATQFVYAKHGIFGCMQGLAGKYDLPDEQVRDYTYGFKQGGQLCLGTLLEDGTVKHEVLLEKPEGAICYPSLSWDARTLVFSMRDNFETDSYYLYTMDLAARRVKQITFPLVKDGKPLPVADCEPAFLPDGRIVFTSTRDVHISDCWYRAGGNIYCCDADGGNIRRLTFDQLMTNNPQVLADGRIVFTRWEYNDRSALFNHPLIAMNPDGTAQTEYYGNNSMFPAAIIHARGIPGTQKAIAVIAGHHSIYKGKLGLIDRAKGIQAGKGIELVNTRLNGDLGRESADFIKPEPPDPSRPYLDFKIDIFGQFGPQYSHPYALDEENYLCSFCPEGYLPPFGPFNPPLGVYYMKPDGVRELLAFDDWQGTGQAVPVMPRTPPFMRASLVRPQDNNGVFTIQDVYQGPGLAGVARGTAKTIRVVALEYRVARMGYGQNGGECETGLCQTPISLNSGSWDVKHVLGEVNIEADGSCSFEVPAHTPVYFQVLDAKGYTIQSMRSWSTLQNGERFSCIGCHEHKNDAGVQPATARKTTIALSKKVQKLKPFAGKEHPLVKRLASESWLDSVENYLGVNAPRSLAADAPVDGFSYVQEIQPIFDRHCVSCHNASQVEKSKISLTGELARPETVKLIGAGQVDPKRAYTQSYVTITTSGNPDKNPWMTWLKPRSRAVMLPPYHTGASKSRIMDYLEPAHYDVKVSEDEKREFACWLDLLVPFCGSYTQHNTWTDAEKAEYGYFQEKRRAYAAAELESLRRSSKD
jgi:mono/diheme cytochrome c family protein